MRLLSKLNDVIIVVLPRHDAEALANGVADSRTTLVEEES